MRLKTKFQDEDFDLGEVVDGVIVECLGKHEEKLRVIATAAKGGQSTFYYNSIKQFMNDWEDAPEEPKEYWYIDPYGMVIRSLANSDGWDERRKEIGNYFETREETEKAVKRLKAWHKLMNDWGTEILGWEIRDMPTGGNWQTVNVKFNVKTKKEPMELLDICFGGGE